jgi:hypothetical protein
VNKTRIEKTAQELLRNMWKDREKLWPLGVPPAIDMLETTIFVRLLGLSFHDNTALGNWGTRYEIAGLIDRQARKIAVSGRFPYLTRRFTAAHEIGHWLLHEDETMHRDLPVDGLSRPNSRRAPKEVEADFFAACLLMPRNLVRAEFQKRFGEHPFTFDDHAAFNLSPSNPRSLLYSDPDSLDRAVALASAECYAGSRFCSLAQQFRVSVTSMAIRLMELELIRFP